MTAGLPAMDDDGNEQKQNVQGPNHVALALTVVVLKSALKITRLDYKR